MWTDRGVIQAAAGLDPWCRTEPQTGVLVSLGAYQSASGQMPNITARGQCSLTVAPGHHGRLRGGGGPRLAPRATVRQQRVMSGWPRAACLWYREPFPHSLSTVNPTELEPGCGRTGSMVWQGCSRCRTEQQTCIQVSLSWCLSVGGGQMLNVTVWQLLPNDRSGTPSAAPRRQRPKTSYLWAFHTAASRAGLCAVDSAVGEPFLSTWIYLVD